MLMNEKIKPTIHFFQEKIQIIKLKTYSLEFQNQLHSVHHPGMPISNYLKKKKKYPNFFN